MSNLRKEQKFVENQIADITVNTNIRSIPIHDTHNCIDAEDWTELLTEIDKNLGRTQYNALSAKAQAINDARQQQRAEAAKIARAKAKETPPDYILQYSRKLRYARSDFTILNAFLSKLTVETMQNMIQQIETRPSHFRSLFEDTKYAHDVLQAELTKRRTQE